MFVSRGVSGLCGAVRPRAIIGLLSRPSRSTSALNFQPENIVSCPSERGSRLWVITRGWAARVRQIGADRRQIFNFLLPGDSFVASRMGQTSPTTGIVALTPVQIVPVDEITNDNSLPGAASSLESACRSAAAEEVNLVLDHVMRLGQQTATERTAHLLLELADRLAAVHLANDHSFNLPIKQECLAQALGMSPVHLNRTLQKLKADGLITMQGSRVALQHPGKLRRLCAYGSDAQEVRPGPSGPSALAS
jgi:CRP-like cAMP-binding protein